MGFRWWEIVWLASLSSVTSFGRTDAVSLGLDLKILISLCTPGGVLTIGNPFPEGLQMQSANVNFHWVVDLLAFLEILAYLHKKWHAVPSNSLWQGILHPFILWNVSTQATSLSGIVLDSDCVLRLFKGIFVQRARVFPFSLNQLTLLAIELWICGLLVWQALPCAQGIRLPTSTAFIKIH